MREIFKAVESYEAGINAGYIVGSKCKVCNAIAVPPRPVCRKCNSSDVYIEKVEGVGKLVTWTEIHISPPSYLDLAPYIVGIVELTNGERLTGIVLEPIEDLEFGLEMVARFDNDAKNASRLRWIKKEGN